MNRLSLNLYQRNAPFAAVVERQLHRFMTAIVGNSRGVVQDVQGEGVHHSRLGLIYSGVETDRPAPSENRLATRARLAIPSDALTLIVVANLIPYKGHRDLIEALGKISQQLPPHWKMLVVGRDDGIGAQLHAAAADCGITDHLMFLSDRRDLEELYAASDIGILASHQEGFANVILEGMRAGLPMVVTDVGGNPEAVIDGVTGLVVPPHDPAALAKAIIALATDRGLRERYGKAGRERVAQKFSLYDCVARHEALYRGLRQGKMPGDIPEVRIGPVK